jgi:hypothetical protein
MMTMRVPLSEDVCVEKESENIVTTITEMVANLPAPVETGLLKAIGQLLGGAVAIPASWLKRPAQAFEDATTARSAVAVILAKGVAENALADPVIMQAAAEIYLPTNIRRARNKVQIAQRTLELAAEASATKDTSKASAPNDDWMNSFMRFAEDASSEQLQDLLSRILAGEVMRPGSFTLSTLRTVAELDYETANDFSAVWAKSVGESVDYGPEFQRGEWFERWKRLVEAGLMAPSQTVQYLPPYMPVLNGNGLWSPMGVGGTFLRVHFGESCRANWRHIDFTRTGRQIGSLLPQPDYETNMREAGLRLAKSDVLRIDLQVAGKPMEVIKAS